MTTDASNLDVLLRAIEVMTAWNDDPDLMGQIVAAQVRRGRRRCADATTVGLGYLCNVLLGRIEQTADLSK
jgi:hypothetical protein